jgi:hypothetical protein
MLRDRPQPPTASTAKACPPGTTGWITAELVAETIAAWQPYYRNKLADHDALEMLLTVGRLFDALGDADDKETQVFGAGASQQS